jgi:hypothetical protein
MSTPVNKQLRTRKMQGLKLQREAIDLMQNRQLYWMRCTHDVATQQIHQEIAELMRKTKDQFNYLLDTLQGTDNEPAA